MISKQEEEFLVEIEKHENKQPCFDALLLRQMGLSPEEAQLMQVFFMKARAIEFNAGRHTGSECMRALISCLKYLPKRDKTGKTTPDSCKASDNFRYEYGQAVIYSHKENTSPVLLHVLRKVFDWIEKFQKANCIYQELPQWLQDGTAGNFSSDSWRGSDLYEGEFLSDNDRNTSNNIPDELATDEQKDFLCELVKRQYGQTTLFDTNELTKAEASRKIDMLLKGGAGT
ncbi:MAG: hypothetical protein A2283_11530 [Lentisphaerae bacterium RIFOXYA12_FULL_48_11]|nr:MAG: hypothetical protein A2283_11530 [Lentisphaerae bacterium RIFOXYA12_FULL_48_11]